MAKNAPVLAHRFPMGTQSSRPSGRIRGVRENCLRVGGRLRVVRHPRMINRRSAGGALPQRGQNLAMDRNSPEGRELAGRNQG